MPDSGSQIGCWRPQRWISRDEVGRSCHVGPEARLIRKAPTALRPAPFLACSPCIMVSPGRPATTTLDTPAASTFREQHSEAQEQMREREDVGKPGWWLECQTSGLRLGEIDQLMCHLLEQKSHLIINYRKFLFALLAGRLIGRAAKRVRVTQRRRLVVLTTPSRSLARQPCFPIISLLITVRGFLLRNHRIMPSLTMMLPCSRTSSPAYI